MPNFLSPFLSAVSFSTLAPFFSHLRTLAPPAWMESGAKDDEQSSLAVFGRDLWCFLSFLSLLCVGRINDTTVSLGRIISHMIYGNYWLNVCDLNFNNFISSPLLLCITANFSLASSHCAVIVRAIVFSLYLPLKYNANYSTAIFHVRSAKALYFFQSVQKKVSLHHINLARVTFCHSYEENDLSHLLGEILHLRTWQLYLC